MGVTRSGHDTGRLRIGAMAPWWARGAGQRWAARGAATTKGVSVSARWDVVGAGGGAAVGGTRSGYDVTGTSRDADGRPTLTGWVGCRIMWMHKQSEWTRGVAESAI